MEADVQKFLAKLDDEIIHEMNRRNIMPEPEYYCECDPDEYRVNFDTLRKEAIYKAIDALRDKVDLSSAMAAEGLMKDLR